MPAAKVTLSGPGPAGCLPPRRSPTPGGQRYPALREEPQDTPPPHPGPQRGEPTADLGRAWSSGGWHWASQGPSSPGPAAPWGRAGGGLPSPGAPGRPAPLLAGSSPSALPSPPLPSLTAESAIHRSHFLPSSPSDAILAVPSHLRPCPRLLPRPTLARSAGAGKRRSSRSREISPSLPPPPVSAAVVKVTGGRAPWWPRSTLGPAQKPVFPLRPRPTIALALPAPHLFRQGSRCVLVRPRIPQPTAGSPIFSEAPDLGLVDLLPLRALTSSLVRADLCCWVPSLCRVGYIPLDTHSHVGFPLLRVAEVLHPTELLYLCWLSSTSLQGLK